MSRRRCRYSAVTQYDLAIAFRFAAFCKENSPPEAFTAAAEILRSVVEGYRKQEGLSEDQMEDLMWKVSMDYVVNG
jgi:hypothetical protein